ncbi:hypothetical protein [Kribbella karoonensis]|jgi:hypothetical protein
MSTLSRSIDDMSTRMGVTRAWFCRQETAPDYGTICGDGVAFVL